MNVLRDGLLAGRVVVISGEREGPVGAAAAAFGARIAPSRDPDATALVHDATEAFVRGGLGSALQEAWSAVAEVANASLIPGARGGKIVLIAPRPDAGEHAEAVRAGLENLARTLSIEWARYGVSTIAVAPGQATSAEELSTLVCFLLSRAGDYYSGCRFDLGALS